MLILLVGDGGFGRGVGCVLILVAGDGGLTGKGETGTKLGVGGATVGDGGLAVIRLDKFIGEG